MVVQGLLLPLPSSACVTVSPGPQQSHSDSGFLALSWPRSSQGFCCHPLSNVPGPLPKAMTQTSDVLQHRGGSHGVRKGVASKANAIWQTICGALDTGCLRCCLSSNLPQVVATVGKKL